MARVLCRELSPPSGIEHAVAARFIAPSERNFIVSRANLLQIYTIREGDEGEVLELVSESRLYGNVQALSAVRVAGRSTHVLLLCFADARVSIVRWDSEINSIQVESLHYYENDEKLRDGHTRIVRDPMMTALSSARCACVLAYDQHIIVLPLQKEVGPLNPHVSYSDEELSRRFPASYTFSLASLGIQRVRDIVLLEGYVAPTLAVLHEDVPAAFNRTAKAPLPCSVTVISLEHALRKQVVLWKQRYIPYHARRLVSVPPPIGGVLVIGVNGIVYCVSGFASGLTLNHFGDGVSVPYTQEKSAHVHVLDSPHCSWLTPTRLLIAARSCRLYLLNVIADGVTFKGLHIQRVSQTPAASSLCTMDSDFVFIGSRLDDSLLLRLEIREGKPRKEKEGDSESEGAGKPTADRRYRNDEEYNNGEAYKDDGDGGGETEGLSDLPELYETGNADASYNPDDMDAMDVDGASLLARDEEAEAADEMVLADEEGVAALPPTQDKDKDSSEMKFEVSASEENGAERPNKKSRLNEHQRDEAADIAEESSSTSDGAAESNVWSEMKAKAAEQDDIVLADLFENSAGATSLRQRDFVTTLTEIDRIPASGPLVDAVVIPSVDEASASQKLSNIHKTPLNDLVCVAGTGESGKLAVFQQSLRPLLHTSFEVPDCTSVWSVRHVKPDVSSDYTSYLLLSRPDSTLVLESGESLEEVTTSVEYFTSGPTIAAGSVAGGRRIVQVYENGVLLLNGAEKSHEWIIAPEKRFKLVKACVLDPFILVQADNKALLVLEAKPVGDVIRVGLCNVNINDPTSHVIAFTLFQDPSQRELFNQNRRREGLAHKRKLVALNSSATVASELERQRQEDADERDLYDDGGEKDGGKDDENVLNAIPSDDLVRPHYAVLALSTGMLQVLRITSGAFSVVFQCSDFAATPPLMLNDADSSLDALHRSDLPFSVEVVELSMISAGTALSAPFLFARTSDGELLVYESYYTAAPSVSSTMLPLRFRRLLIESPLMLHTKPPVRDSNVADEEPQFAVLSKLARPASIPTLIPFTNLQSDIRGMFICGATPTWCVFNRGRPRFYPHVHEGPVSAFAPFHNQSNPYGFIYYNTNDASMKICQLPENVNYETGLISRFVPLGRSVHALAFDAQSKLLTVQTSFPVVDPAHYYQYDLALNAAAEEPKDEETIVGVPLPPRLPALNEERFEVFLINPADWCILDRYQLKEEEHVMSMKVCHLNIKTEAGKIAQEPFIVLGTAHVRGEDHQVMGNIYVMDVLRPPSDVSASRLDIVAVSDQRGAVSSVAPVEGLLVACIGMKVLLFNFESRKELIGCGFFDCQVQIVNTATIKNYILLADVYKSVYFLRWREQGKILELLAKDYDPMAVFSSEFLIDNNSLTCLVSDDNKNVHFLKYDPLDSESRGGQKLLPSGDFYLGAHVNRFLRLRLNMLRTHRHPPIQKYGSLYITLDGGMLPISDHVFNLFGKLEMRMVSTLEHPAGLNPKAFRLSKSWLRLTHNRIRNVIDSQLLRRFPFLERSQQVALAEAVGLTVDDVMDFFMEMDALSAIF